MVQTPGTRHLSRRKSQFPEDEGDDSSATDSSSVQVEGRTASRQVSLGEKTIPNGKTNGKTNGHANGYTNGYINGHVNGHTNGHTNQHINGHTNGYTNGLKLDAAEEKKLDAEQKKIIDGWAVGKDPKVDYSGHVDFGGSWGVGMMIIGFPSLMYYMWIGATFYDGKLPKPVEGQSIIDFVQYLGGIVYEHAYPSLYAWKIYWTFLVFEAVCYCLMPGVWTYGKPLPHLGGKQLKYYCSGVWSWYVTILVMGALHYTGVFPLYTFIDEFGPILSVAICSGFLMSFAAYFSALARGAQHRMTGYPVYDFFMGAELNPRMFGILDFKMFFEVRLPWFILFGLTCGTAARQYENNGYVSGEVGFLLMAHFLYANACAKGEELITTTW